MTANQARPSPGVFPAMPTFTARIGKNWIMRCVIVPAGVMRSLGGGLRIPVVASYAGEKVLTTVMPAGQKRGRLVVLMDILRPAGLDTGDRLEVTLTRSTAPREPVVPADLKRALQFRPAAREAFEQGPPSMRRWMIRHIEEARRAGTRQARVDLILERLVERPRPRAAKAQASDPAPRPLDEPPFQSHPCLGAVGTAPRQTQRPPGS